MKKESGNTMRPEAEPDCIRPLVLVIDDHEFMRQRFRAALEEAGCRVEEAGSGEEALGAFSRLRPDLVVLDLVMPGMNGLETCAKLRSLEEGKHTPILAVTDFQDTASIRQAFEAGATDFIFKPVKGELLGYRAMYLLQSGRSLKDLARSENSLRLLRAAVDSLPIGITITNAEGKIVYTNSAEATMHGFKVGELMQQEARALAPPRLHQSSLLKKLEKIGTWRRESVNTRKGGGEFPVQLSSAALRTPQGEFLGFVTACEDITERKQKESQIHQLAYYDSLTGLPNRALFLDRLEKALILAERSGERVAVLFLDLDNFKDINDTHGHDFGDRLLRAVARRLSGCIRAADTLARLGGDEFVVMLAAADGQRTASFTARRILEAFRTPLDLGERTVHATSSIGIALYPDDASDLAGLLRSADTAMYQAKAYGRQNFQFFSASMNAQVVEKVSMEADLRHAIEQEDLTLYFQPQWDLQTGCHCGVEVLLRWYHPQRGEIPPARFIPLAESSGQIFRLGEWMLRSACAQASAWAQAGRSVGRVAVNISGHQLRQPDFPGLIASILTETKLDPARLELEFTESVLMEHAEQAILVTQELREMGVQLSIDDFGTGYSSLRHLKQFPIDRIKIDRSFVAGIDRDPGDAAIVAGVIALARTLKLRVVAEGVETQAQLEFLREQGCSEVQGFLLRAPMTATQVIHWLELEPDPFWLVQSARAGH